MSLMKRTLMILAVLIVAAGMSLAQPRPGAGRPVPTHPDLVYATVGGQPLKLDLYLPKDTSKPVPLIIHIHGGGWRGGNKNGILPYQARLLEVGFAVASVQYRLTSQEGQWGGEPVSFPAQIQDVKGAVRWLRANAARYGLDPERFGACGESAGGHLTALLCTSGDVKELEGDVGGNTGISSRVQAGVDYFGPTDFLKINDDITTPPGCVLDHEAPESFVSYLIGFAGPGKGFGLVKRNQASGDAPYPQLKHRAELMNPITHVTADDPPLYIGHGTKDLLVPLKQSERLEAALKRAGVKVELAVTPDGPHGDLGPVTNKGAAMFFCDVLWPEVKVQADKLSYASPVPPAAGKKAPAKTAGRNGAKGKKAGKKKA